MAEDFMDKVFSFFSGDGLTDEKQNMLKGIGKELYQNKYAKFFRVRSEETDPTFMSFLFSIYKVIYPIRVFLKEEAKLARLKSQVVESCIDSNVKEIVNRLDTAAIDEKAKTVSGEELVAGIQTDIDLLTNHFSTSQIAALNNGYQMVLALNQFVSYNFPGFFKKFDPHFVDGSFFVEPKFPAIKTILIIDQVGDFLTVTQPLKPEDDWNSVIDFINANEGQVIINAEQFINIIKQLREIHSSKVLELMVQYTLRNPVWHFKHPVFRETVGDTWFEGKKTDALNYIARVNEAKKSSQISALTKVIFESADLTRLENYTVQASETFRRKNVEYFVYAEGINYLKAFIEDYIDKEIKELCDIIIIRGQWTNVASSREMSESLHRLLELPNKINDLDTVMGEDGGDGSRLRASLLRVDRDYTQVRYINSIVSSNNNNALEIINEAAQELINIGKHLKNLIEDVQKKHPELLVNWRELVMFSKEPLNQRMINNYKKINYFIQLMHLCAN
ncbi:MAG: DUF5312 family protein [Treponema sp.]|nr:DUF5312 family protein [Treponema sp.]